MIVIQSDLWLCESCLHPAVNGENLPDDSEEQIKATTKGLERLGRHLAANFDSNDEGDDDEGNGIEEFSWRHCDCCGSTLGGSRHRFAILGEEAQEPTEGAVQ